MQATKTIAERTTQQAGPHTGKRRRAQQNAVCKRRNSRTTAGAIFADSLFTLKLWPKSGVDVLLHSDMLKAGDDNIGRHDYVKIYNDLLQCYRAAAKAVDGIDVHLNMLDSGLSISTAFMQVLEGIKQYVPEDCQFNIVKEDEQYFFRVYHECSEMSECHTIQIAPTVERLLKNKSPFYWPFIQFIALLRKLDISCWYDEYDMVREWLDDDMTNLMEEGDLDNDRLTEVQYVLNKYTNHDALPVRTEFAISRAYHTSATCESVLADVLRIKGHSKTKKLLIYGLGWLKEQQMNIGQFAIYNPDEDRYGLRLEYQFGVMWDYKDMWYDCYEEWINTEAGEGVLPPIAYFDITSTTEIIDYKTFTESWNWPTQLETFFDTINTYLYR
ncbi:hypothetical protein UFOVP74_8 [uncultured Caudovirales phage]|uniref:Uncharacterized protein n=1 Tax=uncultured Caudovirales phage TaxID=2100421 RepID=A0A6J5L345_9CAUD|nr:hypothetical protein UFOVP74_8 [uncultured Caudovirales phage]